MFCINCGEKLIEPNQKFCQNCGNEIPTTIEAPQLRTGRDQYISKTSLQSTRGGTNFLVSQQKPVKIKGRPGPHSKRCLGFGIASCVTSLCVLFFYFSYIFIVLMLRTSVDSWITQTIVMVIYAVGIMFGILSRTNSAQAGKTEPLNNVEKVGSILGIIGIITNAISIGMALISMVFIGFINAIYSI